MKDLESLRARVDETAEKLASAEASRRDRTTSLIGMLQSLEEKFIAQEDELSYYRQRLQPLETANSELATLMEKLLDLIDAGFNQGSLGSLQEAARLAGEMLGSDGIPGAGDEAGDAGATVAEETDRAPEMPDIDAAEEDVSEIALEDVAAIADEIAAAAGEVVGPVEEMPTGQMPDDRPGESPSLVDETAAAAEMTDSPDLDEIELVPAETAEAAEVPVGAREEGFEDVSDAVLDLETDEDLAAGTDDLPDMVRTAAEMAADDGLVAEFGTAAEGVDMAEVAEEIAAAVNAEAHGGSGAVDEDSGDPADDIKALLARVEALAAKAESMRAPEPESASADEGGSVADTAEGGERTSSAA